jgi:hypothetical protein
MGSHFPFFRHGLSLVLAFIQYSKKEEEVVYANIFLLLFVWDCHGICAEIFYSESLI